MTINNVNGSLITRQGASFDVNNYCLTPRHGAAFDLMSNVLPDRRNSDGNVSCQQLHSTLVHCHLRWQK
jgi:hypothetical protein